MLYNIAINCERVKLMLSLRNITKNYKVGSSVVKALRGVSVDFRKNEFVSVLGQSGCGKTTLLNIIGGLDKYTDGDLFINGKSTKDFSARDWDTYRNHSIGFVFQSYNLISHQSVLSNVELALTISGVPRAKRRQRAREVLETVGLGDQLHKKPNQLSGGQMQRVAIARALVNNPDILLADEPTGALDSETSVQIMELLKEVSKDRLVIMVTHNPELAEKYSTRIINLLDGKITADSAPYEDESVEKEKIKAKEKKKRRKRTSMSFFTALSLSFNNLRTKKGRTFLVSFAGSIGIIGIALILSLSNGIQLYIENVQRETLTSYPLRIMDETSDMSGLMSAFMGLRDDDGTQSDGKSAKSYNIMGDVLEAFTSGTSENNLTDFKKYIESDKCDINNYVSEITYLYSTQLNIYRADTSKGLKQVNPSTLLADIGFQQSPTTENSAVSLDALTSLDNDNVWLQLSSDEKILNETYKIIRGSFPRSYDEAVIVLDKYGHISDYTLYSLGLMDTEKLIKNLKKSSNGEKTEKIKPVTVSYDKLMKQKYKMLINTDYFTKNPDGTWTDHTDDEPFITGRLKKAKTIRIVGIVQAEEATNDVNRYGGVGYRRDLMEYLIGKVNDSEIVKQQKKHKDINVFTGLEFPDEDQYDNMTMDDVKAYIATLPEAQQQQNMAYIEQMQGQGMKESEIVLTYQKMLKQATKDATYENNLKLLGVADLKTPSEIDIYPKDFESKDDIERIISEYNDSVKEKDKISYTDYIGLMMDSVTTIINAISYVLIGFVSISLIVSSIMIGIITYISVLERTKEIGVLRAIGARKRDVSRVFNAETLIIGFAAGIIGIGITLLLNIPINLIIENAAEISNVAQLPPVGGAVLVLISMLLTFIAGLVPARIAAKKDPVIALRTE